MKNLYKLDYAGIIRTVINDCAWNKSALHGITHWQRVERNALFLAQNQTADHDILRLFALFHDCKRINDDCDPLHGPRAADYLYSLNRDLLRLPPDALDILIHAVRHHTASALSDNPTIACCWDADRLDITRVLPHFDLNFFSTTTARNIARSNNLLPLAKFKFNSIISFQ